MQNKFKIRCSGISQIMTNAKGSITDIQLKKIETLSAKDKLTLKQGETLKELILKRDTPSELGDTAKTLCKNWVKEQLYKRRKEFGSKQTEKGIVVEENSLDYLVEKGLIPFALKNEQFYENDYITGTPDVLLSDTVIDLKNSWDAFSFPLFEQEITNKAYLYQLQGYMHLTGLKKAKLIYILSNTPNEFIDQEIYYATKDKVLSISETKKITDKIKDYHNYDRFNTNLRVKQFYIEYDPQIIEKIYLQVEKCRKYIYQLITQIK